MKKILLWSSVMVLFFSVNSSGKSFEHTKAGVAVDSQDTVIARIDGEEIRFSDLDYDLQKQYKFELHALQVKLYKEQKLKLDKVIEEKLLEKEAKKKNMTLDALMAMINAETEEEKQGGKASREKLYQENIAKFSKGFAGFAEMSEDTQLKTLKRMLGIKNDFKGPLKQEVMNRIVEKDKESTQQRKKEDFLKGIRAGTDIEITLERPELMHLDVQADDDPYLGAKDAKITLVEFSDYQCPFCSKAQSTLKDLLGKRKDTLKLVFKDLPLETHANAKTAAEAAGCANEQGKFWEYNDLLFENQHSLEAESLKEFAKNTGLDTEEFNNCLSSGRYQLEVEQDIADAQMAGITGTPAILINGYYISGQTSLAYLEEVIDDIEGGRTPRVRKDFKKG